MRQREGAPPRTAYTIREVAESLGLSTRQIYRLAESGELPTKRIGGKLLVLVDDFQQFLAAS
jgi:excisionase family DNA binding protein